MWRRIGLGAALLLVLAGIFVYGALRLALPRDDDSDVLAGLGAPARVSFDGFGVPLIRAGSRADAFAALGYVTARDRLFQMDLMRRTTAGRLAEVFGGSLVAADTRSRTLGFERVAESVYAGLPQPQRDVLASYAAGVNQAMRRARAWPFEFYLLGYRPEPWRPEDSLLVWLGVEDLASHGEYQKRMTSVLRRALPDAVVDFLTPEADCYNELLAPKAPAHCEKGAAPIEELEKLYAQSRGKQISGLVKTIVPARGSNAFAVAGSRTRDGRAILANDMHLGLSTPGLFYRAQLAYDGLWLAGFTMPGVPMLLVGSNGRIAWGVTNLRADVVDLVRIERGAIDPTLYRAPDGEHAFVERVETIGVRGAPSEILRVKETIFGPVLPELLLGEQVAVHATTLDPATTNLDVLDMDKANSLGSAISLFRSAGGPQLNVLLADGDGAIAWTVMGKLPKRFGMNSLFAESWADGSRGWSGYLSPQELPSLVNPSSGFLVNTNQRMLGADYAQSLGREYQGGFRAWRATQQLEGRSSLAESDLFALQLDVSTEYYRYYQNLALAALPPSGEEADEAAGRLRRYLEAWDGEAGVNSLGLPLIVAFSEELQEEILSPIVAKCREFDPNFQLGWSTLGDPVRRIIETNLPALIPGGAKDPTWPSFLRRVLDRSADKLKRSAGVEAIDGLTWGQINKVEMAHPLSQAIPLLGLLLDMPRTPLPGCDYCLRYASENMGAVSRMVVAAGHEADGVLQIPGGQSGEPMSPHYADQQASWLAGTPIPFLVGEERGRLTLLPTN